MDSTHHPAPVTTGHTIGWARHYDLTVAVLTLGRARSVRKMTVELARLAPGEVVLDVGCGTGDLTLLASRRVGDSGQVFGIDAASEMIVEARRKAARARPPVTIHYQVAAVEELPFPNESFNVVMSSLVMHHLPDALKRRALTEMRRVLRPDGRVLVLDLRRPTGHLDSATPLMLAHRHMHTGAQDLPELFEEAGFTEVETGKTRFRSLGFVRASASG